MRCALCIVSCSLRGVFGLFGTDFDCWSVLVVCAAVVVRCSLLLSVVFDCLSFVDPVCSPLSLVGCCLLLQSLVVVRCLFADAVFVVRCLFADVVCCLLLFVVVC